MGISSDLFVGEVGEDLVCSICQEILDGATLSGCQQQHAYCRTCLTQWVKRPHVAKTCPDCRQAVHEAHFAPLKLLDRMVGRLKVKCKHAGCSWQAEYSDLAAHLASTCQYQRKPCPYAQRGCRAQLRPISAGAHIQNSCDYRTVVCPRGGNDCGGAKKGIYMRKDEAAHAEVCTRHTCKNQGCNTTGRLKTLKLHQHGCDAISAARVRAENRCSLLDHSSKALRDENARLKAVNTKVTDDNKKLEDEVARLKAQLAPRPPKRGAEVLDEVKQEEEDPAPPKDQQPSLSFLGPRGSTFEGGDRRSTRLRGASK
ncbi:hypothetical protein BCR35DRAFT_309496 [Leucosporidium creatinivorum]|uniref:RING-type domain-containing protein n=1 Tax=Leucosporidium creatinivorum TaxID=106004 RepID=A0A1Y2DGI8_9BASI|nr:hypothetical protein BCR35DRAFT_309496 [Leucosporidium creatinivorum]